MTARTDDDGLAALRGLRDRLAAQFATRVRDADAPLPELKDLQERLKLLDAAISDPNRAATRRRRATWTAIVAVAAVLSAGALVPMPRVPFTLEAEASAVRLQMPAAGELGLQALGGDLAVDGYSTFESPDPTLTQQAAAQSRGRMSIRAASLNLRRVSFPAATTLDLASAATSTSVALHSAQSPIGVEVEFSGPTSTRFGAATARTEGDYPFAEWLHLQAGDASAPQRAAPPVLLTLPRSALTEYAWTTLRPNEVRFIERGLSAGNEPTVVASLQKAKLQLQASEAEVLLGAGDELDLAGLDLQRCKLVLGPVLRVKMTGTAATLVTRTGQFERSLKPSVLEYAARHKTVALFWSAALLLWGITRWLQRLIGNEA